MENELTSSQEWFNLTELKEFNFLTRQEEILTALIDCKTHNCVIGIYAPILDDAAFITGVDDIVFVDGDQLIVLKNFDTSGHILKKRILRLNDIRSVCPFTSVFVNPYLKEFGSMNFIKQKFAEAVQRKFLDNQP